MDTPQKKQNSKTATETVVTYLAWLFVSLGLVAAWYGYHVTKNTAGGFCLTNLGNLGSYAQGAVASLWSLAALLFLYATLLAQRQQLKQQESQLEQQRIQFEKEEKRQETESKQQDERFQLQQRAIQIQSFENSFFQLLALLTDVRHEVSVKSEAHIGHTTVYKGTEYFSYCKSLFHRVYPNTSFERLSNAKPPNMSEIETAGQDFYMQFYEPHREGLDQYFRMLYHTINLAHTSQVLSSYADKRHYTSIVRAALTDNELFLLFYNGICPHAEKFRPLIETYGLLEHLDKKLLLHESHIGFYDKAFK